MTDKKAVRIQNSILNGAEKKALVWMAERMPGWIVSDSMTLLGIFGALMIAVGFILCGNDINWLWLSVAGFVVNWFGDSLDGTLARVRGTQRPVYGYYLDHTVDIINEAFMFIGMGLSYLMRLDVALIIFILYLCLTLNVSINAHLKSEFKLTYGKLGPTEFRLIACVILMLIIFIPSLREFELNMTLCGNELVFGPLDFAGIVVSIVLALIYINTVIKDAKGYAEADPLPKKD
ncbi:MAG: CDP-alcohol phosphatidyltransferase family protein [Bacteroidales bacterium]|nr:CDP-alcohol phosphatidyltransferase family protein [Bacteroidales bacterium]